MKNWKKRLPLSLLMIGLGIGCAFLSGPEKAPLVRGLIAFGFSWGVFGGVFYLLLEGKGMLYGAFLSAMLVLNGLIASTDVGQKETKILSGVQLLLLAFMAGWGIYKKQKKKAKKQVQKERYRTVTKKMGKGKLRKTTVYSPEVERRRSVMSTLASIAGCLGAAAFVLAIVKLQEVSLYFLMAAYGVTALWYGCRLSILPDLLASKPQNRNKKGIWGLKTENLLLLALGPGSVSLLLSMGNEEWQLPVLYICLGTGAVCVILCALFGKGKMGWGGEAAASGIVSAFAALIVVTMLNMMLPYTYEDITAEAVNKWVSSGSKNKKYQITCQSTDEEWSIDVSKRRYQLIEIGDQVIVREYTGQLFMKWQNLILPDGKE